MLSSYSYRPEIWPALVTLALVIYLGQYSWRRRQLSAATPFAIACVFGGIWTLGVILELSAVDFSTQVFWRKFQAVFQLPVGAAITSFFFRYAGLDRWLTFRNSALLFLIPVLNALMIATNSFHHLMWTGFEVNRHLAASPGPLFWLFNGYVYVLGLINLVVLVGLAIRSPGHRWPVVIILSGQTIARIGFTLEKIGNGWLGPEESTLLMVGVGSVAYAIAFLGFHVIDPVTAARKSILQQMREGMFVLDTQGRILDVNPMGAAIVGIPEARLRKRLVSEVLPLDVDGPERSSGKGTNRLDLVLANTAPARYYDLNRTPLRGRNGQLLGQLLLLHDVTEQKRAQTRILEQQRVVATLQERDRLARELHDGIGQVLGYVGMQTQTALKWMREGHGERAESLLGRLSQVAKEAHADVRESILSLKADSSQEWSFIPNLRNYLDRFQENYGTRIGLSISDAVGDDTFEAAAGVQLLRVVQEALTNSRRHSGARALSVSVGKNGRRGWITITDDGQGFDTSRLEGENGNHLGLKSMRERMEQIGGSLKIDSTLGAGTVVRLDVPTRSEEDSQ